MASAITALDFLATSIGQLAALHEADEEEAIITEGRVITAKREMVKAVTGLLEAEYWTRAQSGYPTACRGHQW